MSFNLYIYVAKSDSVNMTTPNNVRCHGTARSCVNILLVVWHLRLWHPADSSLIGHERLADVRKPTHVTVLSSGSIQSYSFNTELSGSGATYSGVFENNTHRFIWNQCPKEKQEKSKAFLWSVADYAQCLLENLLVYWMRFAFAGLSFSSLCAVCKRCQQTHQYTLGKSF